MSEVASLAADTNEWFSGFNSSFFLGVSVYVYVWMEGKFLIRGHH